jgi:hypothetical protein
LEHTFDIFQIADDGLPVLLKTITDPVKVSAQLVDMYRINPGHYLVFDRETKAIIFEVDD